jgi:hypothetical protein
MGLWPARSPATGPRGLAWARRRRHPSLTLLMPWANRRARAGYCSAQVSRVWAIEPEALRPPLRACTRAALLPAHLAASQSLRVSEILTNRHRDCFCSKKRILRAVGACPFWRTHFTVPPTAFRGSSFHPEPTTQEKKVDRGRATNTPPARGGMVTCDHQTPWRI